MKHTDDYADLNLRFRNFDTKCSNERQYCSPGFNLPVGQFARTVYDEYEEYHNSLDKKSPLRIGNLVESADIIKHILNKLEHSDYYLNQEPYSEPMMSKRDLYSTMNEPDQSTRGNVTRQMMRVLNYSDGHHSVVDIAEEFNMSIEEFELAVETLIESDLLEPFEFTPKIDNNMKSHGGAQYQSLI